MIGSRFVYTVLWYLLTPLVLLRLLWRARRQREYLAHIPERFGFYGGSGNKPAAPLLWLHAVSVGETRAAEPLIRAWQRHYPTHRILLTHMTPTGRATGIALFGDQVLRCYLPYDLPGAVERFLRHYQPAVGVLLETEIWPNLIAASRAHDIPLYLVNARLSEKSFAQYQRRAPWVADSLRALSGIAAQTAEDAARLTALGATKVEIYGNLKFDIAPDPALIERGRQWRARWQRERVLLLASTREGEEALLLDALRQSNFADALIVIVPRHPQRFDAVAALLEQNSIPCQRRSAEGALLSATRVVLGDSMGEMAAYYAACDIAFVGGSLLPLGGQNLIEACALGRPVIVGPHTYNFSEATELAVTAGAAWQVADAQAVVNAVRDLFNDPLRTQQMATAGFAFVRSHQGATARVLEMVRVRSDG